MAKISNSLARSFAKAVIIQNGNGNTPKTMYGTVVQDEGVNYVRIDGSTELTPFSSAMDAVPGNRVSVTIDKGKATIVGNVSAPAQNTANFPQGSVNTACLYGPIDGDTLTIKNINASNIKSGTIDASLITVTNIDANSIKAGAITTDKLDANAVTAAKIASNAVTTDKLNANAVTADKIASNAITTDKLNANAVTTDKLNANAVTADKIASNAITADKIKAGEITSNHISTGGLSASVIESISLNTAVGNIIRSTVDTSLIRELVAGDITALSTSTQNLIIGSGDYGTIEVNGTLIQFKDNTQNHNVYIQLGKDAQGNNSLIVKNQNGATILDSSGVTANAIADELIVNDMLKQKDANYTGISANRLNIDSVVTGINNGTSTINTSKIYFDEGSQTLNTKLSSMTSYISGINTNLSTNYYTKTETTNQVNSIIGSTTITRDGQSVNMLTALNNVIDTAEGHTQTISGTNGLLNRMTTAESKITKDAIINTVSSNMRVGGRNLLIDTETRQLIPNPSSGNLKPTITYETGKTVDEWGTSDAIRAYGSLADGATNSTFASLRNASGKPNRDAIVGVPYVHSIFIKNNHNTNQLNITCNGLTAVGRNIHIYNPGDGEESDIVDSTSNTYVVPAGRIIKFVARSIGSLTAQNAVRGLQFSFGAKNTSTKEFDFIYWHPQIEIGDIATEWQPAPADNASKTTVEQLSDRISLVVDGTSSSSNLVLTQDALTAVANGIDLSGKVTFNSLNSELQGKISYYGTCSTAAGTTAKVVTCSNFVLQTGSRICVYFSNANTAASATLNVNSTGAKTIRYGNNQALTASSPYNWSANSTVNFVYNGTYWCIETGLTKSMIDNIYTSGTTTIEGGKITAGSITADRIHTNGLDASIIKSGQLSSDRIDVDDLNVKKLKSTILNDLNWTTKKYETTINGDKIDCGYYDSTNDALSKNVFHADHNYVSIHNVVFKSSTPQDGASFNIIETEYGTKIVPNRLINFGHTSNDLKNVMTFGWPVMPTNIGVIETPLCSGSGYQYNEGTYINSSRISRVNQLPRLSSYLTKLTISKVTVTYDMSDDVILKVNTAPSSSTDFPQIYNSERMHVSTVFDGKDIRGKTCTLKCDEITTTYSGGSGPRIYLDIYDTKTSGTRVGRFVIGGSEGLRKVETWPSDGNYYQLIYRAEQTPNGVPVDTEVVFYCPVLVIGDFSGNADRNPSDITFDDLYNITSEGDAHLRNVKIDQLVMKDFYDKYLHNLIGVYDITSGARHLNWNADTHHSLIPTMATLGFWNGRYSSSSSNLEYCKKGAFGTMATKNTVTATTAAFYQYNLNAFNLGPHTSSTVGSFSVPAGKYILKVSIRTAGNTAIRGIVGITTDSTEDATSISRGYRDDFCVTADGSDYAATGLIVVFVNQSSETTWYIKAKANAASNIYPHYAYQLLTPTIGYT